MNAQRQDSTLETDNAAQGEGRSSLPSSLRFRPVHNAPLPEPWAGQPGFIGAARSARAAVHASDYEDWQATGGDFLRGSAALEVIHAYQARFI